VGDVGEYEILFCEGFVLEVLDGNVQVSFVVGSGGKTDKGRGTA
jgi:hypothetical protein